MNIVIPLADKHWDKLEWTIRILTKKKKNNKLNKKNILKLFIHNHNNVFEENIFIHFHSAPLY